jgi:putative holliday junction resolvase
MPDPLPWPRAPSGALTRAETILGFDFGERRIGVAVGNTLTGGASPVTIIEATESQIRFAQLGRLIAQWCPDRLVVGRPTHSDGKPLPVTARCERFARQLQGRFGKPVHLVNENYSTTSARALDDEARTGYRGRASREDEDAAAAAIVLQQWLDQPTPALS